MGQVSAALVACRIGFVGWHTALWILETTNLQSFLNNVKVSSMDWELGGRLPKGAPAWLQSCRCISCFSFPCSSSSSPPPPSPLMLHVGISVGLTAVRVLLPNPQRNRPSLWQRPTRHSHAPLDNGQTMFPQTKPREPDSFAPGELEESLSSHIMLHPKTPQRNKPSCLDNKANSWARGGTRDPLFLLSSHVLPCFHLSNQRLFYRFITVTLN